MKAEPVAVVADINKQFGKGAIHLLGGEPIEVPRLTSGFPELDVALGGGIPRGRMVDVFGPNLDGKEALLRRAMRAAQKADEAVAVIDLAHVLSPQRLRDAGVDTERLLIAQPDDVDQALETTIALVKSGAVGLIIVDALPAKPLAEDDDGLLFTRQQQRVSQAVRTIGGPALRTGTIVVFHARDEASPDAVKFYASVRIDVRADEAGREDHALAIVTKNKTAPPYRRGVLDLLVGVVPTAR